MDATTNSRTDLAEMNGATRPAEGDAAPSDTGNADLRPSPTWADAVPESHQTPVAEPNTTTTLRPNMSAPAAPESVSRDAVERDQAEPAPARERVVAGQETVRPGSAVIGPDRDTVLARERDRFGGMKLGSAFFGWLTATGLAVLLLAILTAAGVAFGVSNTATVDNAIQQAQHGTGTAKTVGLVGGIVLLVILFAAYYCGGYVAARMARFNGTKQGFAVWLWAVFTTALAAAAAAIAGSKYNILAGLNLPRIPVKEGTVTTAGLIAIGAAILAALLGALLGGAMGTRYHRKVDAVGFETR